MNLAVSIYFPFESIRITTSSLIAPSGGFSSEGVVLLSSEEIWEWSLTDTFGKGRRIAGALIGRGFLKGSKGVGNYDIRES